MPIDILGSRMAPEAFYGQTADVSTPSSIHKGSAPIKRSAFAKSVIGDEKTNEALELVKRDGVKPNQYQTRTIEAAQYPTTAGMRNRSGEGQKVPLATDRGRR